MYVPHDFVENERQFIEGFIRKHAFGALVSYDGNRPVATQLLFHLSAAGSGEMQLAGHMARLNPQWRTFESSKEVLALFQGPHAYVSAAWYSVPSAPTWNYVTVQAYGHVEIIEDRTELFEVLKALVDSQERDSERDQGYRIESLSADLQANMMNAVVGFRIVVSRVDCAAKLSQNRNGRDYDIIVERLKERGDRDSAAVAEEMERRRARRNTPPQQQ